MTDALQVTSNDDWRRPREQGTLRRLRSGRVVRWKPVELHRLYIAGQIPDELTPVVASYLWGETDEDRNKSLKKFWEVKLFLVSVAVIEPTLVLKVETDDDIPVEYLFDDEIDEIHELATEPAKSLYSFRQEQGTDVEPGQTVREVEPSA